MPHAPAPGKPGADAHTAIVGLQWGDEGKGKVVDLLTPGFDIVARYNGGANAGHSVQVGDTRYALHLVPSGILYPDKLNVLGNGVVVDPAQLVKEIVELRERGVKVADNLKLSDRAHVVFPWHKKQDVLLDQAWAKVSGQDPIGTTGRGIGPCYADKATRTIAIRVGDLLDPTKLREKIERTAAIKNIVLGALSAHCGQAYDPIDPAAVFTETRKLTEVLAPHITDTSALLHDRLAAGQRILFEGANATLLDIDHGTFPFVTSSNCSSLGVHPGTGIAGHLVTAVLGIAKAYQTRVGGGPMPTELHDATGERIREVGREYGTTTGRPRRCGWLDLVALRYSARLSGVTGVALMLLDVLSGLPELKVCTGYTVGGKPLDRFPADIDALAAVEPVYESLPGFAEPVDGCRRYEDLPSNAKRYVERIEQALGVPVTMISVGPKRDQTITR
jgi:adenylosuccinate synthase